MKTRLLFALICLLLLAACGTKGPLVKPPLALSASALPAAGAVSTS